MVDSNPRRFRLHRWSTSASYCLLAVHVIDRLPSHPISLSLSLSLCPLSSLYHFLSLSLAIHFGCIVSINEATQVLNWVESARGGEYFFLAPDFVLINRFNVSGRSWTTFVIDYSFRIKLDIHSSIPLHWGGRAYYLRFDWIIDDRLETRGQIRAVRADF